MQADRSISARAIKAILGVLFGSCLPAIASGGISSNVGREETVLIDAPPDGVERQVAPGSGVIVKKEGDTYTVLTAAHVVGLNGCEGRDPMSVKTSDGQFHSVLKDQIFCPEKLVDASLCEDGVATDSPFAIDLAIVKFQSKNSYKVASKQGEIARNGVHVLVSGYPKNGDDAGRLRLVKSDGPASPPPSLSASTCQGYGLRYVANTSGGMSGGGVWTENGALVGIHGRRLRTRSTDLVLASGSYSQAVPLTYWKALQDPWTMNAGQSASGSDKIPSSPGTRDLISRARLIIGKFAAGEKSQTGLLEEARRLLLLARQSDQQQPLIPALIAQSLIMQYDIAKSPSDLADALSYANDAIDLARKWSGSYDGKFEKIRAHIHALRGNPAKAIVDIDKRLSLAPRDVSALKDKANYCYQMGDLSGALRALEMASSLSPNDPSILMDQGLVYARAGDKQQACSVWEQAGRMIEGQINFSDATRASDLGDKQKLLIGYSRAVGCR